MLIDSNVFMEIALMRQRAKICADLLYAIKTDMIVEDVFVTKFTLNAIEAMLSGKQKDFLRDLLILVYQGKIKTVKNMSEDDMSALAIQSEIGLDFDDMVQFLAASRLGTYLVTYDQDFAKTSLLTKTPEEVLSELSKA